MRAILITLLLSLSGLIILADDWTYADCVEYARQNNISLQKSRLSELSTESSLQEAKAQWQPSLDFSTSHSYTNSPWTPGRNNYYNSNYGLNAGWTVWNGNIRENTIKQDKLNLEISRVNTLTLLQSIETELLQSYFNIIYAKESIAIYEEAVKVSDAQQQRAMALMEAGKISRVDYSQLKNQYEQDKYALVSAQANYESSRMGMKQLLQLGIDAEITLQELEWSGEAIMASLPPMDESYVMALATDSELKGLHLSQEASELEIAIAKGSRLPSITMNAGVGTGYFAPGDPFGTSLKNSFNENIGLTLSIPIFDNGRSKNAISQAKISQLNAELDIVQRQADLAQLVENWYIDTQSSQARYEAALSQLESAALTESLTRERFHLGYVDVIELMTAHNDYINARQSVLQAKYMAMLGKKMIEFYRTASVSLP